MGHRLGGRGFPWARGDSPRVSAVFLFPGHAASIPALLSCCSPAAALVWLRLVWLGTAVPPFHPADLTGRERRVPVPQLRSLLSQSHTLITFGVFCASSPPKKKLHRVGKGSAERGQSTLHPGRPRGDLCSVLGQHIRGQTRPMLLLLRAGMC